MVLLVYVHHDVLIQLIETCPIYWLIYFPTMALHAQFPIGMPPALTCLTKYIVMNTLRLYMVSPI